MIVVISFSCFFFYDDSIFSRDLPDRRSTRGLFLDGGNKLYPCDLNLCDPQRTDQARPSERLCLCKPSRDGKPRDSNLYPAHTSIEGSERPIATSRLNPATMQDRAGLGSCPLLPPSSFHPDRHVLLRFLLCFVGFSSLRILTFLLSPRCLTG